MGLVGVKWFFSPSVPTVAARRVDRLKLLEIEVGDRLEFVGQSRSFEVVRQVVEPGPVLVLQSDQRKRATPGFASLPEINAAGSRPRERQESDRERPEHRHQALDFDR